MNADLAPARRPLSFRRIVDVPFETCLAALDPLQRTGQEDELRFGDSLLHGPIEHDHDSGTCRNQVRLARGPLRPLLRMRLNLDRWSSSTALELIPGERVRPTAAYFRAGHLLLDSLTRALPQCSPAAHAPHCDSAAPAPSVPRVLNPARRRDRGLTMPGSRPCRPSRKPGLTARARPQAQWNVLICSITDPADIGDGALDDDRGQSRPQRRAPTPQDDHQARHD
jgi:hypothetical protein